MSENLRMVYRPELPGPTVLGHIELSLGIYEAKVRQLGSQTAEVTESHLINMTPHTQSAKQ